MTIELGAVAEEGPPDSETAEQSDEDEVILRDDEAMCTPEIMDSKMMKLVMTMSWKEKKATPRYHVL